MRTLRILFLAVIASIATNAVGQTSPAPMRVTGTVERLEGSTLFIKTPEGSGAIALPPQLRVTNNRQASLKDIAANVFIGTTAILKSDGKLHATEIHIFPESMRGSGEGHRPWFADNTTMTNGNVATMTNGSAQKRNAANGDTVLKVSYKGGEQEVHVAPDVPVTMIEAGDISLLKPGAKVICLVNTKQDGSAVALLVSVGGNF